MGIARRAELGIARARGVSGRAESGIGGAGWGENFSAKNFGVVPGAAVRPWLVGGGRCDAAAVRGLEGGMGGA